METDRDYLEITFNTIDEGVSIYDENLKLVKWNKQCESLGIMPDGFLYRGSSLLDGYLDLAKRGVFGEGDPEEIVHKRIKALRQGDLIDSEYFNRKKRLIRIKRFRLENGGLCATFRDVTEERRTEQQLRQRSKIDALGRLSGGVAHDLNNVHAIILGNLELALLTPNDRLGRIQQAMDATERGSTLVRSLLTFARQHPLKLNVTTVGTSLRKLSVMLDPLLRDFVTLDIAPGDDKWHVEIDSDQFETTLVNLVVNAKDATDRGGRISISATNLVVDNEAAELGIATGEYVRVSVIDNGSGMKPDILENAIDPFFTTKSEEDGTGLGLSMADGFASQSSGYLKIDSELNRGTSVHIYLPRSYQSEQKKQIKNQISPNLDGLRVLVVDDDEMLRETIVAQLTLLGCVVTSACSGVDAIVNDEWIRLDVLITDCRMAKIDGPSLAEIAVGKNPRLKVLLISGFLDDLVLQNRKMSGVAEVLQKPFRRDQLSMAINRTIQEHID